MFFKKQRLTFFLSFHFLFHWNSKKQKRKMHPLSFLSFVLTAICVFIPILILSITNGFQDFSLSKLQNFYSAYSIKLNNPIDKTTITDDKNIQGFYEDFMLLKSRIQESPSLIRAVNKTYLENLLKEKKMKLLQGKLPKQNEILIAESLAMQMGLKIDEKVQSFMFFSTSPFPIRESQLTVSGIISFDNATLDRGVAFIITETLSSSFSVDKNQINSLNSQNKEDLLALNMEDGQFVELFKTPTVKQMKEQYHLLLLMVFTSSFLCFFSLYMNLKNNIHYNLYSINVLKILGIEINTAINMFFLQNILITIIGIIIGTILCFSIIPYIGEIIGFVEFICNSVIEFLKTHFITLKDLEYVHFLPADIFYIQSIPVKMQLQDFTYIFIILLGGVFIMNKLYYYQLTKSPLLQSLKMEQGL